MFKKVLFSLAMLFGILGIANYGNASLTFNYTALYGSGSAPAGVTPWLTATFTTFGTNLVRLTIATPGLTGGEFVSDMYFNIEPFVTLGFNRVSGSYPTYPTADITTGPNFRKADGDGRFDILFAFSTAESSRFTTSLSVTYDIAGSGITEDSFHYLSSPSGGSGPFYTAAHIQGINASPNSGWVTTPIPAAGWLLASGLIGLVIIRRRGKK